MNPRVAYLSRGKLFVQSPEGEPREIASAFGQAVSDRALRQRERNGWQNAAAGESSPFRQVLWGNRAGEADDGTIPPTTFTALSGSSVSDRLLYVLHTGSVGGLFHYDLEAEKEHRLFHTTTFHATDLARDPESGRIACALHQPSGVCNIGTMGTDGSNLQQATEGDSLDEAPSWVPGKPDMVVFQSSGIGRNGQGAMVLRGPAAITELNLITSHVETLLANDDYDYLTPRYAVDGRLYCIRRPYDSGMPHYGMGKFLLDFILFPWRIVRAVFGFLNVFSMIFSGKPLTTAGGPKSEGDDIGQLWLRGRRVDAEKALRSHNDTDGAPSLVPGDWHLLRLSPKGGSEVLAKHVVAYDFCKDGSVIYTTGSTVYHLDAAGKRRKLFSGKCIQTVVALD